MYKSFFGLRANPFNVNPDPRFLYLTQHTREALACLSYGIQTRKGFILLSGEVGTGKTTLLNKLLEWARMQRIATAFVFNPRLSVTEFFEFMLADFGITCDSTDKSRMLWRLNQWLLEKYRCGEGVALIIDEAQNLSPEVLEEIRLLTNLETSTEKLLQIVLSGQPELEMLLKEPRLRQLRQRITLRCRTHPLTAQETAAYIKQRLTVAGSNGTPIFAPDAIDVIFQYAQGIPRVINLLCEHALISGFAEQKKPIGGEVVDQIAREFELHEVAPVARAEDLAAAGENLSMIEAVKMLSTIRKTLRAAEPVADAAKDTKL